MSLLILALQIRIWEIDGRIDRLENALEVYRTIINENTKIANENFMGLHRRIASMESSVITLLNADEDKFKAVVDAQLREHAAKNLAAQKPKRDARGRYASQK